MNELIVIGGGPAGIIAALRAAELGAQVTLLESERLGGTCTNDGCVPTRVLAKAARLRRDAEQFSSYGLQGTVPDLDFEALLSRTQEIVFGIQEKKQLIRSLNEASVALHTQVGPARFLSPNEIGLADGRSFTADRFVICAGGHARRLGFPGSEYALTHSDVWGLKTLPARIAIIGAAATGCQLASIFSDFGARVTLIDIADRILPGEDADVGSALSSAFQSQGIEISTGLDQIERIAASGPRGSARTLVFSRAGQTQQLEVDAVILAVGWPGNAHSLAPQAAGVEQSNGFIQVDDQLRTSARHIFAAGDITGRMMLVQSAGYEARIAAENAVSGWNRSYSHHIVPHGGFTDPEYGSVGPTEAEARATGPVEVVRIPFAALDRAVVDGYPEGFCKLIASKDDLRI